MKPDAPEEYMKKADLFQFIKEIPGSWDETVIPNSKIGIYITTARRTGENEKATEQFETVIESLHGDVHSLAAEIRYRSDLGTIAILNAYGYHPMLEQLDALYAAEGEEDE